jgi:hypothetical protein
MCLGVSSKKKIMKKINFFCFLKVTEGIGSGIRFGSADSDPLVRGTDPQIRILTKMSRIPSTGQK